MTSESITHSASGTGDHDHESAALIARLRSGDPEAFRLIDELYARRLMGLARKRLPRKISAKVDAADVVQSVLRTFFHRVTRGEFPNLSDPESCWRVLATITRRKCGRQAIHYLADRRSVGREEAPSSAWEALAQGPSVEAAVVLIETIEQLAQQFEPHQVQMFGLLLDGHTPGQIAEEVGCSKRTVERFRDRLQKRLHEQLEGDE